MPKTEPQAVLDDPFLITPSGDTTLTLGGLIRYGLDQPEDYPAGYCGPTEWGDPRFTASERRHRAREELQSARCRQSSVTRD